MDEMAERAAIELFREAGADPRRPPGVVRVAQALLGDDCFRYLPTSSIAGGAALCRVRERWFIYIAKSLVGARLNHAIGHELGHYYCSRLGPRLADEEAMADRISAALCAPREAFLAAHQSHGVSLKPLASRFTLSLAGAALRLGETALIPTALVKAGRVRVRGGEWAWPPAEHLCSKLPVGGARVRNVGRDAVVYLVA